MAFRMAEKKTTKKTTAKKASPAVSKAGAFEFAVIETGGKQYKVSVGELVQIEKIADKKVGDKVVFDKVLLVDNGTDTTIGMPYIDGASVEATVSVVGRNKKIEVVKYHSKSRYYKMRGHKQPHLKVEITAIK
jgi:large subunit ribosomal protein L21